MTRERLGSRPTHSAGIQRVWKHAGSAIARSKSLEPSVELCREAASDRAQVFGSIGPGPGSVKIDTRATRAFIECLLEAGVDGLLIETQVDAEVLDQLLALTMIARALQSRDIVLGVSLVVDVNSHLPAQVRSGEENLVPFLENAGVDLLAFNCSNGPAPLRAALQRVRADWPNAFGAYPNAGVPMFTANGTAQYPIGPDEFARELTQLQREFELDLIGGCCGATPEHIRALTA